MGNKYRNIPRLINGKRFASKREAGDYVKLAAAEKTGVISNLRTQVAYKLIVNGQLICTYVADFVYYDNTTQQTVVADTKGFRTREYAIKKRLMKALYNISIFEM
jgi:hypothetical protein